MADDTPTVEQAIDILRRLKTWDVLDATPDGAYVRERLDAAIALIAAVRAETAEQIAQLTLQLKTYQAKFVSDGQEILRLKRLTGS